MVATNYFSKWIEVEPLSRITRTDVQPFVWKNIICQFGIPHIVLTNNGLQFTSSEIMDWYKKLNICHLTFILRFTHKVMGR